MSVACQKWKMERKENGSLRKRHPSMRGNMTCCAHVLTQHLNKMLLSLIKIHLTLMTEGLCWMTDLDDGRAVLNDHMKNCYHLCFLNKICCDMIDMKWFRLSCDTILWMIHVVPSRWTCMDNSSSHHLAVEEQRGGLMQKTSGPIQRWNLVSKLQNAWLAGKRNKRKWGTKGNDVWLSRKLKCLLFEQKMNGGWQHQAEACGEEFWQELTSWHFWNCWLWLHILDRNEQLKQTWMAWNASKAVKQQKDWHAMVKSFSKMFKIMRKSVLSDWESQRVFHWGCCWCWPCEEWWWWVSRQKESCFVFSVGRQCQHASFLQTEQKHSQLWWWAQVCSKVTSTWTHTHLGLDVIIVLSTGSEECIGAENLSLKQLRWGHVLHFEICGVFNAHHQHCLSFKQRSSLQCLNKRIKSNVWSQFFQVSKKFSWASSNFLMLRRKTKIHWTHVHQQVVSASKTGVCQHSLHLLSQQFHQNQWPSLHFSLCCNTSFLLMWVQKNHCTSISCKIAGSEDVWVSWMLNVHLSLMSWTLASHHCHCPSNNHPIVSHLTNSSLSPFPKKQTDQNGFLCF